MNTQIKMSQENDKSSFPIQIGHADIHISDLTEEDVKRISLKTFEENFQKVAVQEVQKKIEQKINTFGEQLVEHLKEKGINNFDELKSIDMQYILYRAQMGYVRTDEDSIQELIIKLISERMDNNNKSIIKLHLDEAIEIIPRLTASQIDSLAFKFIVTRVQIKEFTESYDEKEFQEIFTEYVKYLLPLLNIKKPTHADIGYLTYLGCIEGTSDYLQFGAKFIRSYPNLLKAIDKTAHLGLELMLYDDDKINIELSNGEIRNIKELFIELEPNMAQIFDLYNSTDLPAVVLTTVGVIIGIFGYMDKTGQKLNLETWIY
jgi:hypothetical protein